MNLEKLSPLYYLHYRKNPKMFAVSYVLEGQPKKSKYQLTFKHHPSVFLGWNQFVYKLADKTQFEIEEYINFHSKECSSKIVGGEKAVLTLMKKRLELGVDQWKRESDVSNYTSNSDSENMQQNIRDAIVVIKNRLNDISKEESGKFIQTENEIIYDWNEDDGDDEAQYQKLLKGDLKLKIKLLLEVWYILFVMPFQKSKNDKKIKVSGIGKVLELPINDPKVQKLINDPNGDFIRNIKRRKKKSSFLIYRMLNDYFEANEIKD
jgi:hypothetical protein